jgi:hypothetical protein
MELDTSTLLLPEDPARPRPSELDLDHLSPKTLRNVGLDCYLEKDFETAITFFTKVRLLS